MSPAAPLEAGDRMAATDSILWRIEHDPVLRSTVTAVSLLDRAPDHDRLRQRMLAATRRIPRLCQVVVDPPLGVGSPSWVSAPDFDVDYHLRRLRLASPASLQDALDFAAHQAMAGFDHTRPLWEFTVLEDVGEGAVLIQKFHHALTDGVGGVRLALELLDPTPSGVPSRAAAHAHRRPVAAPAPPEGGERPARPPLGRAVACGARLSRSVGGAVIGAARDPLGTAGSVLDDLRWSARLTAPVVRPLSPVMRRRSTRLAFAAFDVDLDRLKAAARMGRGSLNDAFVVAVAGGLRRYHEGCGRPVDALRITLPMSIRRESDPLTGNRFTPVRFVVPLVPTDPTALMPVVASLVRQWRDGPALGLADGLAVALNALPTPALSALFGSLLRNVDFVATNVPGLAAPAYLAGAQLLRQYAFAPPSGSAVNVALLSHVGNCCIGVNMDPAAVEEPELLVRSLQEGFGDVLALAGGAEAAVDAAVGARSSRAPEGRRPRVPGSAPAVHR